MPIEIKKLKKDIIYTNDEVYKLVDKSISYYNSCKNNTDYEYLLVRAIASGIAYKSIEFTKYSEELKHILAYFDKSIKKSVLRHEIVLSTILFKKIITVSDVVYRIAYNDLLMLINDKQFHFIIQWRFEIGK